MPTTHTTTTSPPPPFDPELSAVLAVIAEQLPSTLTPDMIEPMRAASITPPIEELGFDPVTPHGRTRWDLSLALARVRAARLV